jgi:transcriptional regulator with XRE-family HTH domain
MSAVLRRSFAAFCREARTALDITQRELAEAVGVSRGYVAMLEGGRANPSLALVERFGEALGVDFHLVGRPPVIIGRDGQRDLVHAWCSSYSDRRLRRASLSVAREVEVVHGRSHGWIDLLAFDHRSNTLILIELKTRLDDLGAIERQLGWYEREAFRVAGTLGWQPRRMNTWLLFLASEEVDRAVRANRDLLATAFPMRARDMLMSLRDTSASIGRGLAMIDPTSRRRDWLIRTRVDGRRTAAQFRDYADAAARIRAGSSVR